MKKILIQNQYIWSEWLFSQIKEKKNISDLGKGTSACAVKQKVDREAAVVVFFLPQLLAPWMAPDLQSTEQGLLCCSWQNV